MRTNETVSKVKLKARNIRQMRKRAVLVELVDNKDVETINSCDFKKEGYLVVRPKKFNPSIIIYDVEKDYKEEDLKEDLARKNLGEFSDSEVSDLKKEIKFVHNFKVKMKRELAGWSSYPRNIIQVYCIKDVFL